MHVSRSDGAVAVGLAAFALGDVLWSPDWRGPTAVNAIVVPAVACTTALRRTRPLVPLATVAATTVILGAAYGSTQSWTNVILLAVTVYSGAAHARGVGPVVVLSMGAAIAHAWFDPAVTDLFEALWTSSVSGLVLLAGFAGRRLGERSRALDDQAARLVAEEAEFAAAAAQEERRRIARELHDIISHSLGVLVLQAGAADAALGRDDGQVRRLLTSMRATGQRALSEMSTLLEVLHERPDPSRQPLPGLGEVANLIDAARSGGVDVRAAIAPDLEVAPAIGLSIYRVVQEGLTNAMKHSPGSAVCVRISGEHRAVVVEVSNGPASGSEDQPPSGRRGLAGLQERVDVFGGMLDAGGTDDGGWLLRATFPVAP